MLKKKKFLQTLEKEALFLSKLEREQLIPKNLGFLADYFINHPWQIIVTLSLLSTLVFRLVYGFYLYY